MKQAYSRMKYLFLFTFFIFINSNIKAQAFSLDTTFNPNFNFYFTGSGATVYGLNFEPDGKLMVYGYFHDDNFVSDVLRLNKDGNIDNTWKYPWGDGVEYLERIDSNYIVLTLSSLAKFDYKGKIDTSWTHNMNNANFCSSYYNPFIYSDESILVGSDTACNLINNKKSCLRKFLPNGIQDTNFRHSTNSAVFGITKYSTDKLLLYGGGQNGFTKYDNIPANVMCRIDTLGNLDTTFKSIFVSGYSSPIPYYIQNDGKIIVVGGFYINNNNQFLTMIRLNPDGSLDSTFNNFNNVDCNNLHYWINTVCPSNDNGYLIGGGFKQYQGYIRNGICKTDINGFIDSNYFVGFGIDSVFGNSSVLPHVNCIKKDTNDTYYLMGWFTYYNGVHVNPIIRLKGISAGINEIRQEKGSVKVYPNPASSQLTIDLQKLNSLKNTTVSIYDIQGQLLLQQPIKQEKTELNINKFAKGVYIVKVFNDNNTMVSKFVKE